MFLGRDPILANRAAKLLQLSKEARQHAEATTAELARRDLRFVSLERHGQINRCVRLAKDIESRGGASTACA